MREMELLRALEKRLTDTVGSDKRNYEISQARTRTIAAMLYARGSSIPIAMYGLRAVRKSS